MKRQKRFWTWSNKNKRKSRNHKHPSDMIPKNYFNSYKSFYRERDNRGLIDDLNGKDGNYSNWNRLYAVVSWSWW